MAAEAPNPVPNADNSDTPGKKSPNKALIGIVAAILLVAIGAGIVTYRNSGSDETDTQTEVESGQADIFLELPDSAELKTGATVKVGVYENSRGEPINAVQGAVKYPTDKLAYKDIQAGEAFPVKAVTDAATPGLVRFAQNIEDKSKTVTGKQQIATLEFTVKQAGGTLNDVTIDRGFSLVVRSTDNKNILKP